MKIINKNKRAFTLVELMIAIAIICLIMGLFVSLILAVKNSFYRTYTSNDAADYAYLYSKAIENYILRESETDPGVEHTFTIDADNNSAFLVDDAEPFSMEQMMREGNAKWRVYLDGSVDANGLLSYTLYFVDNYVNPGELVLTYKGTLWIPCHGTSQPAASVTITHEGSSASWNGYAGEIAGGKSVVFHVTGTEMAV